MSRAHDDSPSELALAFDGAVKSLRAVMQLSGRTPDQALMCSVNALATLLEAGGDGWMHRLIAAQAGYAVRNTGRTFLAEMQGYVMSDADRARYLLAWLANRECATSDVVAAMERCATGVPSH